MIRFLKIFFGTVFTLLILIGSCVFYAFKIEPYRIASNQLYLNEKTSDFIKVVQFSDTHCTFRINGAPFPRQRCKRLAPAVRYPFVVTC